MQNNTDWWRAFESKRAEADKLKRKLREMKAELQEYKERYETQTQNLERAMDSLAESDRLHDASYGTIGVMSLDYEELKNRALDLAGDVDWFARMNLIGRSDPGLKQCVIKAQSLIGDYARKDQGDGAATG